MSLLLMSFIQLQGMGWLTWVIVGVVVLLALFLIFFFVKGIKKAEKETEEEWSLSQRSIFTNAPTPPDENPERTGVRTAELEAVAPPPPPQPAPRPAGETRSLSSATEAGERAKTEPLKSVPVVEPEPEAERPRLIPALPPRTKKRDEQPAREERGTELLVSRGPEKVEQSEKVEQPNEPAPFDDEVWAGLEVDEQPVAEPPAVDEASESPKIAPRRFIPPVPPDVPREARVNQRRREMFEPPVIESVKRREPFEPPIIEPLKSPDEPPREMRNMVEARPVTIERDVAPQERTLRSESEAPVFSGERAVEAAPQPTAPEAVGTSGQSDLWGTQRTGSIPNLPAETRRSGSILNLPADASDAPMVYGEPAADRDAQAIGSLSNYGKDPDAGKGRKWIGLVVLLGVVVAAVLLYFFVRPINERVNNWFAQVRGRNLAASKPVAPDFKAQIFPARAEMNNNSSTAKAKGRVINSSDAPLEGLSVEVELVRRDNAPPDIRTGPVNPPQLAPNQQGIFEFDIDLKQHTGTYKVNKLIGKDGEISFKTPGQNKPQAQPQSQ